MSPTTFAALMVGGLRANGDRPATGDGRRWSQVADEARALAVGLAHDGVGPGTRARVPASGDPATRLAGEVAVLAVGAVLVVDPDAPADLVVDGTAAGPVEDPDGPAGHEARLAAIDPDAPALVTRAATVTHAQAGWAVRSVASWLAAPLPTGPARAATVGPAEALVDAVVGRWWPASVGATLVAEGDRRARRPDLVVGGPAAWAAIADEVRAAAGRTRAGRALLRRGRVLAAGEVDTPVERVARAVAERRRGHDVRAAVGLDALAVGVCTGPLAPVDARDLAALGLPVVAAWTDPTVPAPVAATPVARSAPVSPWGRPLPGRSVEAGPPVVVHGGDLAPAGQPVIGPTTVDPRGRVLLPRPARSLR